jgi:hypothetical protein
MEFNPSNQRLFQACLAVERARPNDVVYPDRFMDIFQFCERWGPEMKRQMSEDPPKTVADVVENAAFMAGLDSANTGPYLATASVIMIFCWADGEALCDWFEGSRFYHFLSKPHHRLAFPFDYLNKPPNIQRVNPGW